MDEYVVTQDLLDKQWLSGEVSAGTYLRPKVVEPSPLWVQFWIIPWSDEGYHPNGPLMTILAQSVRAEQDRETTTMKNLILRIKALRDTRGQDLIEYALMAGFVAVAAGAVMPGVASSISTIFSKVASVMAVASTQGS